MAEGPSDEELMLRVALGDQRAFRSLMSRHLARVIRLAERIAGANSDADDIAQEAFVRVWTKAASFRPERAQFRTWLYRIVVNLSIDRRRVATPRGLDEAEHVASMDPDAVAMLIATEEHRQLEAALEALSERQRAAIALFYLDGLDGKEAAKAMGLTFKAFESLLHRSRVQLKRQISNVEERDVK